MDMEHQLHQLLPFSPHEHLMMASPGFFPAGGGHSPHFQAAGGFVELEPLGAGAGVVHDDGGGWVIEELMQFGGDLFGGGDDAIAAVGTGDREPWQCDDDDNDGGSPEGPPPSVSALDDGDGSAPSGGGAGSEAHREDGDNNDASPPAAARKRRDRTKTIVSERKRRVRMKEKLYELRALVPNITKMDKASIIADAVAYVKDLQAHARKLKDEVAALEARPRSLPGHEKQHGRRSTAAAAVSRRQGRGEDDGDDDTGRHGGGVRVTRVGAAGVGEGRFFVTVECERRDGVAAPLCAAVESLACFRVENSSLVSLGSDRLVSTLTLKVNEGQVGDATVCEGSVVKLLLMAALLKEGFRHEQTVEIS